MKNIILGTVLLSLGLLLVVGVVRVGSLLTRDTENRVSLSAAVEGAVENTMEQTGYTIKDAEAFRADFLTNLLIQMENDSDIEVQIAGADYEKGMLSVRVVEHFPKLFSSEEEATLSYATTVVMEQTEHAYRRATFCYPDGATYVTYELPKGKTLPLPEEPKSDANGEGTFAFWASKSPMEAAAAEEDIRTFAIAKEDITAALDKNVTYYAVFSYPVEYVIPNGDGETTWQTQSVLSYTNPEAVDAPEHDGKGCGSFSHWSLVGFGGGTSDVSAERICEETTVYGVFSYRVTFQLQNQTVTRTGCYGSVLAQPSGLGNSLSGWKDANGKTILCLPQTITTDAVYQAKYRT